MLFYEKEFQNWNSIYDLYRWLTIYFICQKAMTFYAISFEKWHFFNAFILFCNFTFLFVNYEKKQSFDQKLQAFQIQSMNSKRFFLDTVMVKIIHKFICYSKCISQKRYNVNFTKKWLKKFFLCERILQHLYKAVDAKASLS